MQLLDIYYWHEDEDNSAVLAYRKEREEKQRKEEKTRDRRREMKDSVTSQCGRARNSSNNQLLESVAFYQLIKPRK